MIAAKVDEEVTRKAFMGRVRERKVWKRALAAYTAAPPWKYVSYVLLSEDLGPWR
jgi:hypothetical protein